MPKIGNPIAEGIGGALNSLAQGYAQNIKRQRAEEIFANPNASDIQKISALENFLPKQGAKLYQALIEQKQLKNEDIMMGKYFGDNEGAPINSKSPVQDLMRGHKQFANLRPGVSPFNINAVPQEQPMQKQAKVDPEQAIRSDIDKLINASSFVKSDSNKNMINKKLNYKLQDLKALEDRKDAEIKAQATRDAASMKTRQHAHDQLLEIQNDAQNTIKSSSGALKALDDQLAFVYETGQFSAANLADFLRSRGNDKLADAVQSNAGAMFDTAGKELLASGFKEAFGAKPAIVEFEMYMNMLAHPGRFPDINKLTINSMKVKYQIENDIANYKMRLIAENPDISPVVLNSEAWKYGEQVREEYLNDWRQQVREANANESRGIFDRRPQETAQAQPEAKVWMDLWK